VDNKANEKAFLSPVKTIDTNWIAILFLNLYIIIMAVNMNKSTLYAKFYQCC